MRVSDPRLQPQEPAVPREAAVSGDLLQELKFNAYDATLQALDEKNLTVDRISAAVLREEIAGALEIVLGIAGVTLGFTLRSRLTEEIEHEISGFGPIEPLLQDPEVNDIIVNGFRNVYVERSGELQEVDCRFHDDQHLMNIIQRIVGPIGRRVDESSPYVDARLPDGSRVNAIIPPVALDGPMLSIRKFREKPILARELVRTQFMNDEMLDYLTAAVKSRLNILISGGTGAGKTTLLNVLSSFIGPKERIVTVEDAAELRLQQRHVVRLETRPRTADSPASEVSARDLIRNALRMRPDRIILGEVRGAEAIDMLQAMGTGHDGSMATIHANNARESLERLEILVGFGDMKTEIRTLRRYIANSVNIVVHTRRMASGRRRISSIAELTGLESDTYSLNELYRFVPTEGAPNHGVFERVSGRAHFSEKLKSAEAVP